MFKFAAPNIKLFYPHFKKKCYYERIESWNHNDNIILYRYKIEYMYYRFLNSKQLLQKI